MTLTFLPLMRGKDSKSERALKSLDLAEGKAEGKKEGKTELVIKLLIKKFKKVPNKYIDQIKSLSDDTLDVIATDIFDMDRVEDLERYF